MKARKFFETVRIMRLAQKLYEETGEKTFVLKRKKELEAAIDEEISRVEKIISENDDLKIKEE